MSKILDELKLNISDEYIDRLIDEYINCGERDKAFLSDVVNSGEINKEDSREVSTVVASMYTGDDIKGLAQKLVVNPEKITYKSSDIYESEEVGDTYVFNISVPANSIYDIVNCLLLSAYKRNVAFNITVPRPQYLSTGLIKSVNVYTDEEHFDDTYNLVRSLSDLRVRKCSKPSSIDIPVNEYVSLDIKDDNGVMLSSKIRSAVISAVGSKTKEEINSDVVANLNSLLHASLDNNGLVVFSSSAVQNTVIDGAIELSVEAPVVEIETTKKDDVEDMSDEFEYATGQLDISDVIQMMQDTSGMAEAAEASANENVGEVTPEVVPETTVVEEQHENIEPVRLDEVEDTTVLGDDDTLDNVLEEEQVIEATEEEFKKPNVDLENEQKTIEGFVPEAIPEDTVTELSHDDTDLPVEEEHALLVTENMTDLVQVKNVSEEKLEDQEQVIEGFVKDASDDTPEKPISLDDQTSATNQVQIVAEETLKEVSKNAPQEESSEVDFATEVMNDLNKDLAEEPVVTSVSATDKVSEEQLGLTAQISDLTTEISKMFENLKETNTPKAEEHAETKKEEETIDLRIQPAIDFGGDTVVLDSVVAEVKSKQEEEENPVAFDFGDALKEDTTPEQELPQETREVEVTHEEPIESDQEEETDDIQEALNTLLSSGISQDDLTNAKVSDVVVEEGPKPLMNKEQSPINFGDDEKNAEVEDEEKTEVISAIPTSDVSLDKITNTDQIPVIPEEYSTSEIKNLTEDLSEAERNSLAENTFVVDEKNRDLIIKYSLVSNDPRFFGLQLQLPNGNTVTVLDYLEENKVLDKIPLDSEVITSDGEKMSGADFIKRIIPDYVNRYSSLDEIIDTFTEKITPKLDKTKNKGLFGKFIRKAA